MSSRLARMARILALLSIACVTRPPPLPAPAPSTGRVGVHGMILVGEHRLFFSHIPMFSPPHDAEVLFEGELGDFPGRPGSFATGLFTFEPHPFALDALMSGLVDSFEGDVYRGSFEDGGEKLAANVRVRVLHVLVARHLDDPPGGDVLFGEPSAAFIRRAIKDRSSVDQIVRAHVRPGVDEGALALGIPLPSTTRERLHPGDRVGPATVAGEISCLVGPDYDHACPALEGPRATETDAALRARDDRHRAAAAGGVLVPLPEEPWYRNKPDHTEDCGPPLESVPPALPTAVREV